jgi:hypothetical protein
MTGNFLGLIAPRFGQYALPRTAAPKGLIILEYWQLLFRHLVGVCQKTLRLPQTLGLKIVPD